MAGVSKSLRPNDLFRRTHHTASLWSPDLSDSALLHLHRKYEIESIIIVRKCNLGGTSRALRTIPLAKDRNSTKSKIREACADVALTPFHGLLGNVEAVVRPGRRDVARECRRDSAASTSDIENPRIAAKPAQFSQRLDVPLRARPIQFRIEKRPNVQTDPKRRCQWASPAHDSFEGICRDVQESRGDPPPGWRDEPLRDPDQSACRFLASHERH